MALVDSAETLVRHLRRAEELGVFNTAAGPLLQIRETEVNPLIDKVENDIRAIREGGAAEVILKVGKPVAANLINLNPAIPVLAAISIQTKAST